MYSLDMLIALTEGDPGEMKIFISQFIEDIKTSLSGVAEAITASDVAALKFHVHRLKPSTVNLQINSLAGPVAFLEDRLAAGEINAEVRDNINLITVTLSEVISSLEEQVR
jgi:HPt (histidine-containing phosphotransfer) domain-containing protein